MSRPCRGCGEKTTEEVCPDCEENTKRMSALQDVFDQYLIWVSQATESTIIDFEVFAEKYFPFYCESNDKDKIKGLQTFLAIAAVCLTEEQHMPIIGILVPKSERKN